MTCTILLRSSHQMSFYINFFLFSGEKQSSMSPPSVSKFAVISLIAIAMLFFAVIHLPCVPQHRHRRHASISNVFELSCYTEDTRSSPVQTTLAITTISTTMLPNSPQTTISSTNLSSVASTTRAPLSVPQATSSTTNSVGKSTRMT